MKERVLVVAAHADDEVIGVGGTLLTMSGKADVAILILTESASVQFPDRPEMVGMKQKQAERAAEALGAVEFLSGGLPDQGLDALPVIEVNRAIEKAVSSFRPTTVFAHHHGDMNKDHRIVSEAALVACRPYSSGVRSLLSYPVDPLSHPPENRPVFNVFVDIYRVLEKKLEIMGMYDTEVRPFPHPRSIEALRHQAVGWGARVGLEAAEPFQLIFEVR